MLGMHFDGDVNVITVPVYYSKRIENHATTGGGTAGRRRWG